MRAQSSASADILPTQPAERQSYPIFLFDRTDLLMLYFFQSGRWGRHSACLLAFTTLLTAATVVDRIAVIVGRHAIKTSDIDRELRVSSFINRQPLDQSP